MAGTCVLCTLGAMGDAAKCVKDPNGPVCVAGMNGTVHCGCMADSDCGGPNSGKVCDSVPQTCVDGCRGMGGNGCKDGLVCSSIDNTIGTCGPKPEGAGGGGGAGGRDGSGGAGGGAGGSGDGLQGDKGSCGCSVPGDTENESTGAAAAALAMIGIVVSRRRRRA